MGASATADEHAPAAVDVDSDTAHDETAAPLARSGCAFFSVREAGAGAGVADDEPTLMLMTKQIRSTATVN